MELEATTAGYIANKLSAQKNEQVFDAWLDLKAANDVLHHTMTYIQAKILEAGILQNTEDEYEAGMATGTKITADMVMGYLQQALNYTKRAETRISAARMADRGSWFK